MGGLNREREREMGQESNLFIFHFNKEKFFCWWNNVMFKSILTDKIN